MRAAVIPLAVVAFAGPAVAQPISLGDFEVEATVNQADVMNAYPPRALLDHVEGTVSLLCVPKPSGALERCEATENPAGHGFGEAAITLARKIKLKPGAAPAGNRIAIPVTFAWPAEAPGPPRRPIRNAESSRPGDAGRYAPMVAVEARQNGVAIIDCDADAKGALTNCVEVAEAPKGFHFVNAALRMSRGPLTVVPAVIDGKPVEKARVRVDFVQINRNRPK